MYWTRDDWALRLDRRCLQSRSWISKADCGVGQANSILGWRFCSFPNSLQFWRKLYHWNEREDTKASASPARTHAGDPLLQRINSTSPQEERQIGRAPC